MDKCIVKIQLDEGAKLPQYSSLQAAGADICACLAQDQCMVVKPMQRVLVPTGIRISLPVGYEAQIRPRSGLAIKSGITVLNTPGTVDSDYRGEVKVILINLSDKDFIIRDGDRIAQMVIARHENASFETVVSLDETERGEGGFGSTGV
ncbi:MAG: dUTP diphosphatase [Sphaerochaetaceae bacterium]|nr:dUTP diphosphatase [Sphaerochaetaceae bacterium]